MSLGHMWLRSFPFLFSSILKHRSLCSRMYRDIQLCRCFVQCTSLHDMDSLFAIFAHQHQDPGNSASLCQLRGLDWIRKYA
ncbi:hypothetical protein EV361DRAFT_457990 [Lentinula raphanica]|nr:hypothetical protein EV361DRAFT_457990 [Lentinula raphanica]